MKLSTTYKNFGSNVTLKTLSRSYIFRYRGLKTCQQILCDSLLTFSQKRLIAESFVKENQPAARGGGIGKAKKKWHFPTNLKCATKQQKKLAAT